MRFRVPPTWSLLRHRYFRYHRFPPHYSSFTKLSTTAPLFANGAKTTGSNGGSSGGGNSFVLPGATAATILMLGLLHARRMYEDKKVEDMKERGLEVEFSPDAKAAFLRLLPLRSMSRCWGFLMSVELPVRMRPFVYKAWARAFHSNLDEAALPLENYTSLQEFFARTLKDGLRPIDPDPNCLISPVDCTVLRFGELKGPRAAIEQVKGYSYSALSLLGENSLLHEGVLENGDDQGSGPSIVEEAGHKAWWRISFASPKVQKPLSACPTKGVFYCVLYLKPGDYHRVHSPVDWQVLLRRHFPGRLFPLNERATRTIANLHVENERVVLEGKWQEGFMAIAAIGATNIGSIKVSIEPELRTNKPLGFSLESKRPDEKIYQPKGTGIMLKKGEEIATFNMGSTVVLVFQGPVSQNTSNGDTDSEFEFCIKNGDRIKVGEAIGRWSAS